MSYLTVIYNTKHGAFDLLSSSTKWFTETLHNFMTSNSEHERRNYRFDVLYFMPNPEIFSLQYSFYSINICFGISILF